MKLTQTKGFSLVELLTVVALIGIIAGIGTLSTRDIRARFQLRSATLELYSDLQMARLGAIRSGRPWVVCFSPGDTTVTSYTIGNAVHLPPSTKDICNPADDPTPTDDPAIFRKTVDLSTQSTVFYEETFSGTKLEFEPRGSTRQGGHVKLSLSSDMASGRKVIVNNMTGNLRVETY